ncbi:MAG: LacI family DNA-binding transcriptional regulator [Anaerolineaceae bacterium]|nr:LacI family DNA-binding transcriptional regulator [Anaerolineaceae bacterium]
MFNDRVEMRKGLRHPGRGGFMGKLSLSKIAELASVNASTVSRTLNPRDGDRISAKQRQRILSLCNELNYRPQLAGRSVATGRSYRVAFISGAMVPDLSSPTFALFLRGLCRGLQQQNYSLTILSADCREHSYSEDIHRFIMSDVADAYLLGPSMLKTEELGLLGGSQHPVLFVDFDSEISINRFAHAVRDCSKAYREVWRQIPEDCHGRIAFISPSLLKGRLERIQRQGEALGIPREAIEPLIYKPECLEFILNHANAATFARDNFELLKKFRILWCSSDLTALGVAEVLSEKGLKPGQDILLLGQDNIEELLGKCNPFLSTIDPQNEQLGTAVAQAILQQIEQPDILRPQTIVQAVYMPRASFPPSQTVKLPFSANPHPKKDNAHDA